MKMSNRINEASCPLATDKEAKQKLTRSRLAQEYEKSSPIFDISPTKHKRQMGVYPCPNSPAANNTCDFIKHQLLKHREKCVTISEIRS